MSLIIAALAFVAACAALRLASRARRCRPAIIHPFASLARRAAQRARPSRVPAALFLASLASCSATLAHPLVPIPVPRSSPIVLCLDDSASMALPDVAPSRLEAAKRAIRSFLASLPRRTSVGLVAFSSYPVAVAPPTTDRDCLLATLSALQPQYATAIGSCILEALDITLGVRPDGRGDRPSLAAAPHDPSPAADIVVISDGGNDMGADPVQAARLARSRGARVHAVLIAAPGGVSYDPDAETEASLMRRIALEGGGLALRASDAATLASAYRALARATGWTTAPEDASPLLAALAAALLAASLAMRLRGSPLA